MIPYLITIAVVALVIYAIYVVQRRFNNIEIDYLKLYESDKSILQAIDSGDPEVTRCLDNAVTEFGPSFVLHHINEMRYSVASYENTLGQLDLNNAKEAA